MTFLNPFVLFGLAAAAIPIILHLLNIRKLRTIEFSTLTFLKELQKSKMRRVKIRQWLLLFLRTLIVVLVVFAFSRPALRGTLSGIGTHARTTIVMVLDDTYSMGLQNERGSFMKQAQATAMRLVDMLREGDDALLIRLSELPRAAISEPIHDLQKLREAIRQTGPSYKTRTFEDAVPLIARLVEQSKNFNKEVYFLTDDQKTTILNAQISGKGSNVSAVFNPNVRLFLVPLSDKQFENIGIEKVEIPPTLFQKGKPFLLRAAVRNFGSVRVQNSLVNLFLDGARVAQKGVSLEGGERTTVEFVTTPERTGFLAGFVELEEDAFDADNRYYLSLFVPREIDIVLASAEPKGSGYLHLALGLMNREGSPTALALKELPPDQLTSSTLAKANVAILSDVPSLTSSQAAELARFSSEGGGIIFFPGDRLDVAEYSRTVLPRLGLPPMLPIQRRTVSAGAFVSFDKIDLSHPLFQGMFEKPKNLRVSATTIESPRITSSLKFASEATIRPIISLSDGTPFLWERISHRSNDATPAGISSEAMQRVLGFAVSVDTRWSDFPVKNIFVPLLYQTVLYAASGRSGLVALPSTTVGDGIDIPVLRMHRPPRVHETPAKPFRVIDPKGKETLVQPYAEVGPAMIRYDKSSEPGVYTILQSDDTLGQIPVNMNSAESNGERAPFNDVAAMLERYGLARSAVTAVPDPETIDTAVLQSRFGVELWKYFLAAALVVALVEMLVAREPKQEVPV